MHTVRRRYHGLDTLRGVTLVSMMAYHACWDLVYIFGMDWDWYESFGAYLWQQSICWTFILLSGYCVQMGRHRLRRGLLAFGGGALVSAVTFFFMPEDLVFWGVLSLLGAAVLLTIPLEGLLWRWRAASCCSCSCGTWTGAVWASRAYGCAACRRDCTETT